MFSVGCLPLPIGMMIGLSLGVIAWQHVVGHTTTSAYTMHTPPIILLCSISTCTAIVSYFFTMGIASMLRYLGICSGPPAQGSESSCGVEYEYSFGKDASGGREGEVLTLSMVWAGVYGLGLATFFLGYIITMASTLSSFSFLVGLYAVSLYETVKVRMYSLEHGHSAGKAEHAQARFNSLILVIGVVCMSFMGVHIASIDMNMAGRISAVDAFMGVIFPATTPWLLKGIGKGRNGSIPVLATWEVSLPFTMAMSILFIVGVTGSGSVPYQVRSHIARYTNCLQCLHRVDGILSLFVLRRNVAAATTIMPFAWGVAMLCILQSVFHNNTIHVFATFMTVASGRELTLYNTNPVVWCMFITSLFMFAVVMITHSKYALDKIESVPISPSILMAQRVTHTLQEKESLAQKSTA